MTAAGAGEGARRWLGRLTCPADARGERRSKGRARVVSERDANIFYACVSSGLIVDS